jgi:hypothetical protein
MGSRGNKMNYPEKILPLGALIMENADILSETYEADPDKLASASNVVRAVEAFSFLKEHAEEVQGAFLQILTGSARIIYLENLYELRAEAEPIYFAAKARCEAEA